MGKTNELKEHNLEFKATGIEATHPRVQQSILSISGYCFNSPCSQQSTAMFTWFGQVWGHILYPYTPHGTHTVVGPAHLY